MKALVSNVKMEELVFNGLSQFDENPSTTANRMQTERHVAKFKGSKPIGRNGSNFLNRTKVDKLKTNLQLDPSSL